MLKSALAFKQACVFKVREEPEEIAPEEPPVEVVEEPEPAPAPPPKGTGQLLCGLSQYLPFLSPRFRRQDFSRFSLFFTDSKT